MKKLSIFIILLMCLLPMNAQQVTIKDVANATYRAEGIRGIRPMLDGEHYTQISSDGKRLVKYSFKTGKEVATIFDVETARDCTIKHFDDYIMSPNESLILIQTDTKPIYRHSFTANYYIFNVKNNKMEPLSTGGPQQVPLFSPDGNQIAFVRNNNIYLVKLLFNNSESQITTDGKYNEVLNGIPDWVYEEEFGFNRAFDFSADSKMIAYIRFDESKVPMYSFPLYKGKSPSLDQYATYPGEYEYKYPMPGIDNSKVSVHTFDIKSKVTRKIDLPLDEDGYIPRIKFTNDENALAIMTLNRHQNRFDLYYANPRSTLCKLMVRDEAPQYIKENAYSNITFYPEHFVVMSEKDGYNHLYLYTAGGNLVKQITKGNFEVKDFLGWDQANNTFYQAVTLVESVKPEHQAIAQEVIEKCLPYSGRSIRIGISGVPGAGKSTSIDVFGLHVLRQGGKLAVLAIDPSSERSKGSILGDKTRMEKLSVHPNAFIRPSPSAGSLGGVARKTRETIILCEAGGFDKIFIETVGVGQSETAVHSMVDFFLLIQLAGTGDELQGIKRGIMEMADGIVINKADGNNIEKAKLAASHFRNALHLFPAPDSGWSPKVLTYSGFYGLGIKEIWDMVDEYFAFVKANGYFEQRRNEQAKYWMYESINEHLRDSFYNNETIASMLAVKEEEVLNGKLTSFVAAKKLLDAYYDTLK